MVHAVVANQRVHLLTLARLRRVVDGDGVSAEVLHEAHARDVCRSVADVYHVRERHGARFLLHVLVHEFGIVDRFHTLVYLEDKLRLVGIVHRHGRPVGDAVHIVEERAGVNLAELVGDCRALDNLFQTRRVDIVQNLDSALLAVCVHAVEPLLHTRVESHAATRLLKGFATERQPLRLRRLNHSRHVCQNLVGVLLLGEVVRLRPELLVALADGRNEVVFLHVARRQSAVEVVDKCYREAIFRVFCHSFRDFDQR